MPRITLPIVAVLLTSVLALAPGAALAADEVVVADPAAEQVTALDGTIVWVRQEGGQQRLMQRTAAGEQPVEGAPAARYYRSIDLGRDRSNRLVLTYRRCDTPSRCVDRRDDLRGRRASFRGLSRRAAP
jgi:hypothetical protein